MFPLSDSAAVCGFEAFINGKHVVGQVQAASRGVAEAEGRFLTCVWTAGEGERGGPQRVQAGRGEGPRGLPDGPGRACTDAPAHAGAALIANRLAVSALFCCLSAGRVHHQRRQPAARRRRPHQGDLRVRAGRQGRERPLLSAGQRGALAGERGAPPDHAGERRLVGGWVFFFFPTLPEGFYLFSVRRQVTVEKVCVTDAAAASR